MSYVEKLAEIAIKELGNRELYCIRDSEYKIIAGQAACDFYLRPHITGGWQVLVQEGGRGNIYQDYHFENEREACRKFIEVSEYDYHLSKYLSEFE